MKSNKSLAAILIMALLGAYSIYSTVRISRLEERLHHLQREQLAGATQGQAMAAAQSAPADQQKVVAPGTIQRTQAELGKQAPMIVNAREIFADYRDNEIRADGKYLDKAIQISGIVKTVGKTHFNIPEVLLESQMGDGSFLQFRCEFSEKQLSTVAQLSKGKPVTVIGQGGGKVAARDPGTYTVLRFAIRLKRCEVAE